MFIQGEMMNTSTSLNQQSTPGSVPGPGLGQGGIIQSPNNNIRQPSPQLQSSMNPMQQVQQQPGAGNPMQQHQVPGKNN